VIGVKVTLEEMGGARMHTGVSGCGHFLVKSDEEGIDTAKRYLSYFGANWEEQPPHAPPGEPAREWPDVPEDENKPFDMIELIEALVDAGSFLEVQARWANEFASLIAFREDGTLDTDELTEVWRLETGA